MHCMWQAHWAIPHPPKRFFFILQFLLSLYLECTSNHFFDDLRLLTRPACTTYKTSAIFKGPAQTHPPLGSRINVCYFLILPGRSHFYFLYAPTTLHFALFAICHYYLFISLMP